MLVHSSIAAEFIDQLGTQVSTLRIGDPQQDDVEIGPLAFRAHYERVLSYIETARREGAELVTGGGRPAGIGKGYYVEPTVFRGVVPGMTIAREEIFGPVLSIMTWDDYDDMISVANGVEFGLAANIWTNDHSLAQRTARLVQAWPDMDQRQRHPPCGRAFRRLQAQRPGQRGQPRRGRWLYPRKSNCRKRAR